MLSFINTRMEIKPFLIGGEWRTTPDTQELRSPYTGDTLARVCYASRAEVEEAVAVAAQAAVEMRELARYEVAEALRRVSDYIQRRREDFARTIALESGKPIATARGEVDRGVSTFAFA